MKKLSRDQRRRKKVAERERRRAANEQRFVAAVAPHADLCKVLTEIAGGDVVLTNDMFDGAVIERGKVFSADGAFKIIDGQTSQCHKNVAVWFYLHGGSLNVVTGYAFQKDMGRWVGHSWLMDGETILETTHRRDHYFGVVLKNLDLYNFLVNNTLGVIEEYGMNIESDGRRLVLTPELPKMTPA